MCEYCGLPVDGKEPENRKVILSTIMNGEIWIMATNVTKPFINVSLDNALYARNETRKYMFLTSLFDIKFCPMCGVNLIDYVKGLETQ